MCVLVWGKSAKTLILSTRIFKIYMFGFPILVTVVKKSISAICQTYIQPCNSLFRYVAMKLQGYLIPIIW